MKLIHLAVAGSLASCVPPQNSAVSPSSSPVAATTGARPRDQLDYKIDLLKAEYRRGSQIAGGVQSANNRLQAIQESASASGKPLPSLFASTLTSNIRILQSMQDSIATHKELGIKAIEIDSTHGGTYAVERATAAIRDANDSWERALAVVNGKIDAMSEEAL